MDQHEYTATVYIYPGGRMAVHGNSLRGLVLEVDTLDEMRSELLRLVPILLWDNHELDDSEIANVTLRLSFHDTPSEDADLIDPPTPSPQAQIPTLLWEDSPCVQVTTYA
ncbi:MAG: hypothetical protein F4069_09325 [Rhodothermaceae bacterium]|nr:hypothetical protein [Rhodothermaceae bacterium]MXW33078.1 hypothetical protein [Rhodothermaceae bacterium]MXZ17609.1 hypothetical protein [Rhodothermaceae bacterium]MYC05157.1 hypothetical protein [Rhodothermaceae bacterium]MYE63880.1 hypothetical protein [Rhodothermaceae bacterium]